MLEFPNDDERTDEQKAIYHAAERCEAAMEAINDATRALGRTSIGSGVTLDLIRARNDIDDVRMRLGAGGFDDELNLGTRVQFRVGLAQTLLEQTGHKMYHADHHAYIDERWVIASCAEDLQDYVIHNINARGWDEDLYEDIPDYHAQKFINPESAS